MQYVGISVYTKENSGGIRRGIILNPIMLEEDLKKFIEDYMAFSCKYCAEVKNFTDCEKLFTKCLDKALYMGRKFTEKGWSNDRET